MQAEPSGLLPLVHKVSAPSRPLWSWLSAACSAAPAARLAHAVLPQAPGVT